MIVIPAIDLKGGRCVRLLQGREKDETVYSDDPAGTALKWESLGASLLHIVDLDGAFKGKQENLDAVKAIRNTVSMKLELGGGIRDMQTIDMLISIGIDRVILGTSAAEDPDFVRDACKAYPGKLIIGIDAKQGMVAIKGWVELTEHRASDFAIRMQDLGASGIVYTDIMRDGMLSGPNIDETAKLASHLSIPVIASGGIKTLQDVQNLLDAGGIWGAITGKAIYSGSLNLKEAIDLCLQNA